jgi:mono/diheme cytochrome c family protein
MTKRYRRAVAAAMMGVGVLAISGCTAGRQRATPIEVWDDMRRQEKFKPQAATSFFADGRASRRAPAGTIARGYLKEDDVLHTGLVALGMYAGRNPHPINPDLLKTGQARFNTYCSPCHDRVGTGKGIVALRTPSWQPTNLHEPRVRAMTDGELFSVITDGRRSMPAYKYQIQSELDRWAIVAYLRALQRASTGTVDDVPVNLRAELK